jgi:hypothetical protein
MAGLGVGLAAGHALESAGAGPAKFWTVEFWTVEHILMGLIAVALLTEGVIGLDLFYRRGILQHNPLAPTSTPTLTATFSPTPTRTATFSPTPTYTATATATATATLLPLPELRERTQTPRATSTATATLLPLPERTQTPSATKPGRHLGQTPTPPGQR